jgi:tetratricopeptide (TPR) repeat protein/O-antigen ligase
LSVFCDKVIEAGWLIAVVVVPLFFNIYSHRVFEPDKLSLLRSIALVMAVAWLIKFAEERLGGAEASKVPEGEGEGLLQRFLGFPLTIPILALVVVYFFATLITVAHGAQGVFQTNVSFWGSYQRLQGTYTTLSYLVIFFLVLHTLRSKEQLNRLITVMIITSLPIALYGILQHYKLDPLPWGGDVTTRVASTMGNAIFVAAYLIMVMPLTLGRLIQHLESPSFSENEGGVPSFLLASAYMFLLALQGICIVFTQSRGPLVGILVGIFAFVVVLGVRRGLRWLWGTAIAGAVAFAIFFVMFNLPGSPLEPLQEAPYIGRLGKIFQTESGTGKVRVLIWEGVVDMLQADPVRAVVGYGPESMYVAFNPYYPPDLAHYEKRNASPDRAHNETFDVLSNTGFIGFVVYVWLFTSVFYYGLKWLGLVGTRRHRNVFLALWLGLGALSVLGFRLIEGTWRFAGVALPSGMVAGLVVYLMGYAIFVRAGKQDGSEMGATSRQMLLIALISALAAHFAEIHFGIAIAASRTYFWVFVALMIIVGLAETGRLTLADRATTLEERAVPVESTQGKRRKRKRRDVQAESGTFRGTNPWWRPSFYAQSLLVGLILSTLVFDFFTRELNMPVIFALTWVLGGAIVLAEQSGTNPHGRKPAWWGASFAVYSLICGIPLLIFLGIRASETGIGQDPANLIVAYYIWMFGLLLVTAAALLWESSIPRKWLQPVGLVSTIVGAVLLAITIQATNVDIVRADIYYKQGLNHDNGQRWDFSISEYMRAIRITPDQDFYYLFLGRAMLEKAKVTPAGPQESSFDYSIEQLLDPTFQVQGKIYRDDLLQATRIVLERARELNPLNTDHSANMGRLHRTWGEMSEDPVRRMELLEEAIRWYDRATQLSRHNAQLFNEWGVVLYLMGDYEGAIQKYEESLSLDRKFAQTYLLLGDACRAVEDLSCAQESYATAVDLQPKNVPARSALALTYANMGLLEEAVRENRRVIELKPGDYDSHKNLSLLYREMGRTDDAIVEAELAMGLAPEEQRASWLEFIAQLQEEAQ